MNIEEGGRRLVLAISWILTILVWIAGAVISIIFAFEKSDGAIIIAGCFVTFIVGFIIKAICHNFGLWVLEGYIGDQKNKD